MRYANEFNPYFAKMIIFLFPRHLSEGRQRNRLKRTWTEPKLLFNAEGKHWPLHALFYYFVLKYKAVCFTKPVATAATGDAPCLKNRCVNRDPYPDDLCKFLLQITSSSGQPQHLHFKTCKCSCPNFLSSASMQDGRVLFVCELYWAGLNYVGMFFFTFLV